MTQKRKVTTALDVIAAIDAKQLRGRVLSGPTPGRFYAEVEARDLERWHAKHGDEYAAETCGKIANDALLAIGSAAGQPTMGLSNPEAVSDLINYGQAFVKDGKRIDPEDIHRPADQTPAGPTK